MNVVSAHNLSVKRNGILVFDKLSFQLKKGQAMAVTGLSGSGKTTLLEALAGRLFYSGELLWQGGTKVAYVPQQHHFRNLSHTDTFYYQQRFNAFEADDAPTVAEAVPLLFGAGADGNAELQNIKKLFDLDRLQHRRLLHLSNGEHKRLQIAGALQNAPSLLLLDNPFTGLDVHNREILQHSLKQLVANGTSVLLACAPSRTPTFVQEVLVLESVGHGTVMHAAAYANRVKVKPSVQFDVDLLADLLRQSAAPFIEAVRMVNVQVRYGAKSILQNINWQVQRGERWSLSGPNGAGKSTLLSLITADNPQAYANEIYLFDKRRGRGESIWDIKQKIGYVSPELHLHFERSATVFDTIASGFFDTIGLFRTISVQQAARVHKWLQLLQLTAASGRLLWQLPLGVQRLVLLARAMIKNPSLLVLDEPLQGLDEAQTATIRALVDAICMHSSQTLIFVSHYTEDLPNCVDRYLRLEEGRIVEERP